jgi:beta-galactosidase
VLPALTGLAFGGDYNPEQWDEATWQEDDALMRQARVNLVSLSVFSWALLEPEEGRYEFGWLDRAMDRLHANGVHVALATPTASPPPWFTLAHPEAMPVRPDGVRLTHGSRDTYCAAAPAYRRAAVRIAEALAERYADHPALALWHIHNEYGTLCWCDRTAAAFRRWLRERYGAGTDGLAALNDAWGTAFWSQTYGSWEQIQPPRDTQWRHNPGQLLDFRRFWSDELLAAYREQRDAVARFAPHVPATTNLMLPAYQNLDLWKWGHEVDVVGVDHYMDAPGVAGDADAAFGADRARSFGRGAPWLLVEQATSTIYAGDRVLTKEPGRVLRSSLAHIARGSDGAMFFQWRASKAGAELWHSAIVPHAGADSRVFREAAHTGACVERLAEVAGSRVTAEVAILWDADAWWALNTPGLPSGALDYLAIVKRAHRALWDAGVTCDFAHPEHDLSGYRLVLAPSLYLVSDAGAASLRGYVRDGGTLLVQYFSGVVDERHQARLGGHPGAFRDVLGIRGEQFHPLARDTRLPLSDGSSATEWSEELRCEGAQALVCYAAGPLTGAPAVTRHGFGAGTGWYVSTRLDDPAYASLIGRVLAETGVTPVLPGLPSGVEAVRRHAADGRSWLFVLNHTDRTAEVPLPAGGVELLTGRRLAPGAPVPLPAGECLVLREVSATP